jgi:hypothetical protein
MEPNRKRIMYANNTSRINANLEIMVLDCRKLAEPEIEGANPEGLEDGVSEDGVIESI